MHSSITGTILLALAASVPIAGCSKDPVGSVNGPSPVNAVAFNRLTLTPDPASFKVTRGVSFNYVMDVQYRFTAVDFSTPVIEFDAYAGVLNAQGEFFPSPTCWFNLKIQNPRTASGNLRFSGTFTLPQTAACASHTDLKFAVFLFSATSQGFELASDVVYYKIN